MWLNTPLFLPSVSYVFPCLFSMPQFQQLIVDVARVWRNSDELYDWNDFHRVLYAATMHAVDMGLVDDQRILERIMWRGTCVMRRFKDPDLTLAMFTDKLPNARGVGKAQLQQDQQDARALQKAFGVSGGPSAGSGTGAPSSRSRGGPSVSSRPRGGKGFSQPASGGYFAPGGGAGAAVSLPLPVRAAAPGNKGKAPGRGGARQGGVNKGGGSASGGGGGRAPTQSNRGLSAIADFNGVIQDAQQQFAAVPGAPTCDKCAKARPPRNPNHDFRKCAFSICSRCKRGGHRASDCPF